MPDELPPEIEKACADFGWSAETQAQFVNYSRALLSECGRRYAAKPSDAEMDDLLERIEDRLRRWPQPKEPEVEPAVPLPRDRRISWEMRDCDHFTDCPEACAFLAARYEQQGERPSANCIRAGMPVDHDSHVALLILMEYIKASAARSSADDGWNYDMSTAPTDGRSVLAATRNGAVHLWSGVTKWENPEVIAWRPLPPAPVSRAARGVR